MSLSFKPQYRVTLPSPRAALRERMLQYEQDNEVRLAVRKLFILMPMSCYIEPVLGSSGDEDIEVANPMDDLVLSRGGTQARTYNNTVYKIRNGDDRPYYVVAEGATPLLTLNEMRECGELTAEQLQEQIINFLEKIHELVYANAACRSSILLLPYRGVHVAVAAVSVAVVVVARQGCYLACELYWLPVKSVGSASKMLEQCSKLPYSTLTVFGACIIMSFLIVIENLSLLWDIISTAGYVHFLVALINTLCVWRYQCRKRHYRAFCLVYAVAGTTVLEAVHGLVPGIIFCAPVIE
ncbi:hypothetical protein HPB48_022328 [Haemaphysalis longicornis]|uniref:STING ligand-binding domain-containing protein n=1 Tax=Haemaphysalis longicornis TaxID=44386 RepID=A0A9J6H397_HAELO|nr:hypothetical protein HPB48_022328 [Haemaphysalis longicornis]